MLTLSPNIRLHPNNSMWQSEMSIAVHPANQDILLAGSNTAHVSRNAVSQGWYYSTNSGLAWTGRDTLPTHTNFFILLSDPAVGFDLAGRLFFNALQYQGDVTPFVARSTNGGAAWSQLTLPGPTTSADKNHLAIDVNPAGPFPNNVYTAFTDFDSVRAPIVFLRSTDNGQNFSTPVSVSGAVGSQFAQGVNLAVGPGGQVYAVWSGYDAWPPPVTTRLGFNKSLNGGATWGTAQSIRTVNDLRGYLTKGGNTIRVSSFPSMAVDRSGGARTRWIYVVYAEKNPVQPDIFLIRSTNGGTSWSAPRLINTDTGGNDQWFPWIAVDPTTGALFVVYYDSRNFPANDSAEVYLSFSRDGGDTFEDVLVSDQPFLPAPIPGLAPGYAGDYIGVTALNGFAWPCWNDNRTGLHQAYASRIQVVDVTASRRIQVNPDSLSFGSAIIGYPETLTVRVRNIGLSDTLRVTGVTSTDPEFLPTETTFNIAAGEGHTLSAVFSPAPPSGTKTAVLSIASNDSVEPMLDVPVSGVSVHPSRIAVAPDSFSFMVNEGDSVSSIMTISDTGLGLLEFEITSEYPATTQSGAPTPDSPHSSGVVLWGKPPTAYGSFLSQIPKSENATDPTTTFPVLAADSVGDAFGVDVGELRGRSTSSNVTLQLVFATALVPSNFGGFVGLDTDQNRTTGVPMPFGAFWQDVGCEYYVDFFSLAGNLINVYNAAGTFLGAVPALVDSFDFTFSVPLSMIGGGGGGMNIASVVGDNSGPTDWIPDSGHGTVGARWLTASPSSGTVPGGGNANVTVRASSPGLLDGTYNGLLRIAHNDPSRPVLQTGVQFTVVAAPNVTVSPDSLDFGTTYIGYPDTLELRISNTGSDTLQVAGMNFSNPHYATIDSPSFFLPPYENRRVRVMFSPLAPVPETGTLTISSNDPGNPPNVSLSGTGVRPPVIGVSPDSLSFVLNEGDTVLATMTIGNTGLGDLTFSISHEPLFGVQGFSRSTSENAPRVFDRERRSPGARAVAQGRLFGVEWDSIFEIDVTSGQVIRRLPSPAPGADYGGLAFSGSKLYVAGLYYPSIIYVVDPDDGSVLASYPAPYDNIGGLAFVNDKLYALVYSTMIEMDPRDGRVLRTMDLPGTAWPGFDGGHGRLFVAGYQAIREIDISTGSVVNSFPAIWQIYGLGFTGRRLFASGYGSIVEYDPDTGEPLDTNSTYYFSSLAGGEAEWLSETPTSGTVPPGGNQDISIRVRSDVLEGGTVRADILIDSNDPSRARVTVPVRLRVTGTPNIDLSADTVDFDEAYVGFPDSLTLEILNHGTDTLRVASVTSNNPVFSVGSDTAFDVAQHRRHTMRVRFLPTTAGVQTATLTLSSNDPVDSSVTIFLVGTGIDPPQVVVSPDSVGLALASGDTAGTPVVLSNAGLGPLTFSLSVQQGLFGPAKTKRKAPPGVFDQDVGLRHPDGIPPGEDESRYVGTALNAVSDWISVTPDSGTIGGGGDTTLMVRIRTDSLGCGQTYGATIFISSNDPGNSFVTIPVQLMVFAGSNVIISLDTVEFFEPFVGYRDTAVLLVSNIGCDSLHVTAVTTSDSQFTPLGARSFVLEQGESRSVAIEFFPTSLGQHSAQLFLSSDDPTEPVRSVALQGNALFAPAVSVTPESLFLSLDAGDSTTSVVTIENTGASTLRFRLQQRAVAGGIEEVFGDSINSAAGGSNRARGNVYFVNSSTKLLEFKQYMGISLPGELRWVVCESNTPTGVYTRIHQTVVPSSGTGVGFFSSGPLDVSLTAGRYYFIGVGYQLNVTLYLRSVPLPISISFGSIQFGGFYNDYPVPDSTTFGRFTNGFYTQALTTVRRFISSISPDSGSVAVGGSTDVQLVILGPSRTGTYLSDLEAATNDPARRLVLVPVRLDILTDVDERESALPKEFALHQNYPNPFNPRTTIRFDVPKETQVTLKVYNILGQEVVSLADTRMKPGRYFVDWDAARLASGVYFYRLQTSTFVDTKKLLLLR